MYLRSVLTVSMVRNTEETGDINHRHTLNDPSRTTLLFNFPYTGFFTKKILLCNSTFWKSLKDIKLVWVLNFTTQVSSSMYFWANKTKKYVLLQGDTLIRLL